MTTLRMIAGLEEITSGELWIDGQLCNYVEAKDRDSFDWYFRTTRFIRI